MHHLTILSYPEAFTPSHPGNKHDDTLGVTTARSTSMGGKNDAKMNAHDICPEIGRFRKTESVFECGWVCTRYLACLFPGCDGVNASG